MASEEQIELFEAIISKGCCKRCFLRYLGWCKTLTTFGDPDTCLMNFGFIPPTMKLKEDPQTKKHKSNPCVVCLGLLQDVILDQMLSHENLTKIQEYKHDEFVAYITFPKCILMRDHSMKIYLKQNFPKCFDESAVIKINHAWRYSVEEKLCQMLNKRYAHGSKLTLHFYTSYALEQDEIEVVQNAIRNQGADTNLSRHYVHALLESIEDEDFMKFVTIPPRVPLYEIILTDVKYFSEAIHLTGNYNKYSRNLIQVPTAAVSDSIETIILSALQKTTRDFRQMIFQASSFDERRVRVLGNGRTFHLQINDPKFKSLTKQQFENIEKEVANTKLVSIKNLRQTEKKDIASVMDSERLSPKTYKLLCILYEYKNVDYCVNAVNMHRRVTVYQRTPTRLITERPIKRKRKKIFYIRAKRVKDKNNVLELDLCTEGGFYVPEFVHGDLGRTKPSLGDIMKAKVDVLGVDVIDFFATIPYAIEEEDAMRNIMHPSPR